MGSLVLIVTSMYVCFPSDGTDSVGGRGGVLPLLAPSSHRPSVGGVWLVPFEPSIFYVPRHRTLPGLQQLLCQPHHLRFPFWKFPEGVQASVQVPKQRGISVQRRQGGTQQSRDAADHQLYQRLSLSERCAKDHERQLNHYMYIKPGLWSVYSIQSLP